MMASKRKPKPASRSFQKARKHSGMNKKKQANARSEARFESFFPNVKSAAGIAPQQMRPRIAPNENTVITTGSFVAFATMRLYQSSNVHGIFIIAAQNPPRYPPFDAAAAAAAYGPRPEPALQSPALLA